VPMKARATRWRSKSMALDNACTASVRFWWGVWALRVGMGSHLINNPKAEKGTPCKPGEVQILKLVKERMTIQSSYPAYLWDRLDSVTSFIYISSIRVYRPRLTSGLFQTSMTRTSSHGRFKVISEPGW